MVPEATVGSNGTVSSVHEGDPEMSGSEVEKHVLDKAEIRRAIRKMDLTILPVMTMFYLLSFLVNLSPLSAGNVTRMHTHFLRLPGPCQHWYVNSTSVVPSFAHEIAGNARVAGLQRGLRMTDHQYQICITVTYVLV